MASYDKDYYKELQDENYKTLLSSEIQLDNARQRAMKNTQTQMNSLGMGSSGYGSTVQTGIENQYITGLQNAQNQYQQQSANIAQQQRAEETNAQNDRFNSLTSLMTGATTNDELNSILTNYGYGAVNEGTGQFEWNKEALAKMNQDDALQLQSLYGLYNSQIATNSSNNMFNQSITGLTEGNFTSMSQLEEFKKNFSNYDKMSDEQKAQFDFYYKQIENQLNGNVDGVKVGTKFDLNSNEYNYYSKGGDELKRGGTNATGFGDEYNSLMSYITSGNLSKGSYIQLKNGSGDLLYLYYGSDGVLYNITKDVFTKSKGHKVSFGK